MPWKLRPPTIATNAFLSGVASPTNSRDISFWKFQWLKWNLIQRTGCPHVWTRPHISRRSGRQQPSDTKMPACVARLQKCRGCWSVHPWSFDRQFLGTGPTVSMFTNVPHVVGLSPQWWAQVESRVVWGTRAPVASPSVWQRVRLHEYVLAG